MGEIESITKQSQCDSLMEEGIACCTQVAAIARLSLLATFAVELKRKDAADCALEWCDSLDQTINPRSLTVLLDYIRAGVVAGERYGTHWQWEQPTLAREIFYLRRGISHKEFSRVPDNVRCMCLNNLGARLRVAGRAIEALDCWHRVLKIRPNFGMALCNCVRILVEYARALEDREDKARLLFATYSYASAAVAPTALYTDAQDAATKDMAISLKKWIESVLDVTKIVKEKPFEFRDRAATDLERDYRRWCLANALFLNPSNDLGEYSVETSDSLQLPTHVVFVDASQKLESFFDQMKQEYVSARWMLYDGLTSRQPHFSDKDVILGVTEPRPALGLNTEKVKIAYRMTYSLFDKISFFINAYMDLGIPEKAISFRGIWRAEPRKPILRAIFSSSDNWALCALYWLAKDLFEEENDEVAEPHARRLCDMRNHVEHKYLRVAAVEPATVPEGDLALTVSRQQFENATIHLLKLARAALIYLTIGVGLEEKRRDKDRADVPIEQLPTTSRLPDDEKI